MKPLKLVMSAFGPYKDLVEVDFSLLGENGIFLVTGDTGAGKTTIFDGISFALFGESSGSHRESTSFRSKFASSDTETYVELTFLHRDKEYIITRNPAYLVPKKRGSGETTKAADATIVVDGNVITGLKVVNEKVTEILGINSKQFKQIAMLAQGEFLKILYADSDERKTIFRKIFGTEVFDLITSKLNEKYKNNKDEIDSLKTEFITNSNNIILTEGSIFVDKSNLTKESVVKVLDDLDKEIKLNEKNNKEIDDALKLKEVEYKGLSDNIKLVDDNNKRIEAFNKLLEECKDLKLREEKIKNIKDVISTNNQVLRLVKPIEVNIIKIQELIKSLQSKIKTKTEVIKKLEVEEKLIGEKEENIKLLSPLLDEFNNIKNEIKSNEEKLKDTVDLLLYYKEKSLLDISYIREISEYKNMDSEYREEDDKYFRNQAGILALKLEDNKPCLVCGSLEHPSIAIVGDNVLTKEELDLKKTSLEEKLSKVNKLKESISAFISKIDLVNKKIGCGDEEEVRVLDKTLRESNDLLNKKLVEITSTFNMICSNISTSKYSIELFNLVEFIENFNKDNAGLKQELESNRKLLEEFNNNLEQYNFNLGEETNKFNELILSLGYKDENDFYNSVLSDEEIKEKENIVSSYEKDIVSNKTRLEEVEKLLVSKEIKDLTNELEKLDEVKKEIDLITLDKQKNYSIYDNNIKISKRLSVTSNKLIDNMDKFSIYEELYKLSSGNITGKRKISFEQYVQATYFDMVLYEANLRFNNMTDGRFRLLRKESADSLSSKFALDLDVFDEYNGSRRDVKSLSGGESFKASLSLALGLSDVIQNYSGGVVIDTLFIDEGFGSLDQESREQAINTLNLISNNNKLIGIISHVSELKNRIDKKIIVSKTRDGSEVKIEV